MNYEKFKSEGEVYLAMRTLAEDRDAIRSYFYFRSKVWKAIRDHIAESKDCVLFDKPADYYIAIHRGTGHSISMRDFGVYAKNYDTKPPSESSHFWIEFAVGLIHEEDSHMDYPNEREKTVHLNVPTELMMDFTKGKFDAWIAQLRRERDDLRSKADDDTLRRLVELYPDKAKKFLEERADA